jgi:hypothetical protein
VGRALAAVEPEVRAIARANRAFLGRAVRFLGAAGIGQFLDIGSGIPTQGNVHEVAQQANPGARVVYADIDPVAIAHSRTILAERENAAIIEGDLREPEKILAHDDTRRLIDFSAPAGLLLVSVLHYVSDAEDPWTAVASLRDALAPGSYLVLCHGTAEGKPDVVQAAGKVFNRSVAIQSYAWSRGEIMRLFGNLELVDPGLVHIPLWRPDSPADVPSDPSRFWCLAGVAQKPL